MMLAVAHAMGREVKSQSIDRSIEVSNQDLDIRRNPVETEQADQTAALYADVLAHQAPSNWGKRHLKLVSAAKLRRKVDRERAVRLTQSAPASQRAPLGAKGRWFAQLS